MSLDAARPGLNVDDNTELLVGALVTDGRAGGPAAGREFEVVVFDNAVGLREIERLCAPCGSGEAGADVGVAPDRAELQRVAGARGPGAAGEGDLGLDGGAKRRERSDCEVGDRDSAIEVGVPGGERLEPFVGRLELRAGAWREEAGLPRREIS